MVKIDPKDIPQCRCPCTCHHGGTCAWCKLMKTKECTSEKECKCTGFSGRKCPNCSQTILDRARKLVAEQANDEGLWFLPQFITEAYFQERLRALHAVVEDKTMDEVVSELAAGNLTSPLPGEGFRCPHGERPSRICGQCVAKIRAEGFQKGYAQGLEDGQSRERIGLD